MNQAEREREKIKRRMAALDRQYQDDRVRLRRELAEAEAAVRASRPRPTPRRKSRAGIDPHQQAGRYYGVALDVMRRLGRASRAQVGREGGIGTGTLTHAMRALEMDGLVRPTGEQDARSDVFVLTARGRRARIGG